MLNLRNTVGYISTYPVKGLRRHNDHKFIYNIISTCSTISYFSSLSSTHNTHNNNPMTGILKEGRQYDNRIHSPKPLRLINSSLLSRFMSSTTTSSSSSPKSDVSSVSILTTSTIDLKNPLSSIGKIIPASTPQSLRTILYNISDAIHNNNTSTTTISIDKRIQLLQSYIPIIIQELSSNIIQQYKQTNKEDYSHILVLIIAAYTRGKGTGKLGNDLLKFLYSTILTSLPYFNTLELAIISEAYTHIDRKNILEHNLQDNYYNDTIKNDHDNITPSSSTFTELQRQQQTKQRTALVGKTSSTYPITGYEQYQLYQAIYKRTLELVATFSISELQNPSFYHINTTYSLLSTLPILIKKQKLSIEQIKELYLLTLFTSQDNLDALIRCTSAISRADIPCNELLDKLLPYILQYLQYAPLGEKYTHTLVRISNIYSRMIPNLGTLLDPFAERLNKELKYATKSIIDKEDDELLHKPINKYKNNNNKKQSNKKTKMTISTVDGIRKRLQPLIGAIWHLAIATQFQFHIDVLVRGIRFINHACSIGIRLSQNTIASNSSNKTNVSKLNTNKKQKSSLDNTNESLRSLRLNTSDIGRLAAIQLGIDAYRIQKLIQQNISTATTEINSTTNTNENNKNNDDEKDTTTSSIPSVFIPNLHQSIFPAIDGWHKLNQLRLQTSSLQLAIRRTIVELCNKTRLPTPIIEKPIEQGLIVDFGWKLYDPNTIENSTNSNISLYKHYPIGVAIEVDGPRHYVSDTVENENQQAPQSSSTDNLLNTDNQSLYSPTFLDGPTMYKYWLLESFGWQVIHIPYQEWKLLDGNSSSLAKQQYILNRLRETPLKNSIRL